jgi:hypothetical protein
MKFTRYAYEKYKLHWMLSHGHTLKELMEELDFVQKYCAGRTVSEMFDILVCDSGLNGEMWVCYEEFMECEFMDEEYMENILTLNEMLTYMEYMMNQ